MWSRRSPFTRVRRARSSKTASSTWAIGSTTSRTPVSRTCVLSLRTRRSRGSWTRSASTVHWTTRNGTPSSAPSKTLFFTVRLLATRL